MPKEIGYTQEKTQPPPSWDWLFKAAKQSEDQRRRQDFQRSQQSPIYNNFPIARLFQNQATVNQTTWRQPQRVVLPKGKEKKNTDFVQTPTSPMGYGGIDSSGTVPTGPFSLPGGGAYGVGKTGKDPTGTIGMNVPGGNTMAKQYQQYANIRTGIAQQAYTDKMSKMYGDLYWAYMKEYYANLAKDDGGGGGDDVVYYGGGGGGGGGGGYSAWGGNGSSWLGNLLNILMSWRI